MARMHPELEHFVDTLTHCLDTTCDTCKCVELVEQTLQLSLEKTGWLPLSCQEPTADECYARHLVHLDPQERFSIVAMVWKPGQKTPIHDHGGVWCVEGVYTGRITINRYDLQGAINDGVAHFIDGGVLEAGRGETGALIPPTEYHTIANETEEKAVTVHIYGADLKTCNIFLPQSNGIYEQQARSMQYTSTFP